MTKHANFHETKPAATVQIRYSPGPARNAAKDEPWVVELLTDEGKWVNCWPESFRRLSEAGARAAELAAQHGVPIYMVAKDYCGEFRARVELEKAGPTA
ncbi:hypothetical protein [Thermopirellula anaerolimosa]